MFNFSYYRNFIEKSKYLKTDFRRNPVSQDWFSGICFFIFKSNELFFYEIFKKNFTAYKSKNAEIAQKIISDFW